MRYIVDDFGNILSLRTKNAEVFCDYVKNNYDTSVPVISGKLYHTLRVADACITVAEKLGVDKELAYNVGLLHDFSRFSQWQKYQTFADRKTVDHADEAARLLFDEGQISLFEINEKDRRLIKLAVKNHNKKEINFEEIKDVDEKNFDKIVLFCKIIRDCDKLDIAYRFYKGDLHTDLSEPGVSQKVLDSFKKHQLVNKNDIQTGVDEFLTHLAYLFDMNFVECFYYLDMDKFFEGIERNYCQKLNKEDYDVVERQIDIMKNFISEKMAEKENNND